MCALGSHVYFLWMVKGLLSFELVALYQFVLQNHKTPVHMAAHSGHVSVLRVLIKGYHADKMVKAMVNDGQTYSVLKSMCICVLQLYIPAFMYSLHLQEWSSAPPLCC